MRAVGRSAARAPLAGLVAAIDRAGGAPWPRGSGAQLAIVLATGSDSGRVVCAWPFRRTASCSVDVDGLPRMALRVSPARTRVSVARAGSRTVYAIRW